MDTQTVVLIFLTVIWGVLELRHLRLRAGKTGTAKIDDQKTLETIFLVAVPCVLLAVATYWLSFAVWSWRETIFWSGTFFAITGMALRDWSTFVLGRFFVIEVAVQKDQTVVDRGPYRFVRHPSYAGAMATMLGVGLMSGNWTGLGVAVIPGYIVLLRRIRLEEEVLARELGEPYKTYMTKTKRLVPFVY